MIVKKLSECKILREVQTKATEQGPFARPDRMRMGVDTG